MRGGFVSTIDVGFGEKSKKLKTPPAAGELKDCVSSAGACYQLETVRYPCTNFVLHLGLLKGDKVHQNIYHFK